MGIYTVELGNTKHFVSGQVYMNGCKLECKDYDNIFWIVIAEDLASINKVSIGSKVLVVNKSDVFSDCIQHPSVRYGEI